MNKKGFTLIELLAVILILGIIMLIAIPVVNNAIKEARRGAFNSTINTIEKEAQQVCKMDQLQNQSGGITFTFNNGVVSKSASAIHDLELKGDLPDSGRVLTNSNCNVKIDNVCKGIYCANKDFDDENATITDNNTPGGNDSDSGATVVEPTASDTHLGIVYLDPSDLTKKCTASSYVKTPETKTGCMKWYIIKKDSSSADLLLDHSINTETYWNTGGYANGGPTNLLPVLKSYTSGWDDTLKRNDSYTASDSAYTINYKGEGYKARLLTLNDIKNLTGSTPTGNSMNLSSDYGWLFDNLKNCSSYGCPNNATTADVGYWLADYYPAWYAWAVEPGCVNTENPHYYNAYGVRPVITVPMSYLK